MSPEPHAAPQEGSSPTAGPGDPTIPKCSRASLEATWGHQPALWHPMESSKGFFFCRLPEKAQRTPQVQLQGKQGGDRWDEGATKELPFSVASAAPQPLQLPK